jgi:hypothetical protein
MEVVPEKLSTFLTAMTIEYGVVSRTEVFVKVQVVYSSIAIFKIGSATFITNYACVESFNVEF